MDIEELNIGSALYDKNSTICNEWVDLLIKKDPTRLTDAQVLPASK